jgi:hypothetical protein
MMLSNGALAHGRCPVARSALAVGAGVLFFRQPTLVFENRLADMVTVQVGGEERRILPGGSFTLKLERARRFNLSWQLTPRLGVALGDTVGIAEPRGTVRLAATSSPRTRAYFAPVITNETGEPLSITVNAGSAGAMRCGCTVPPGAVRMLVGYYPLYQNSTVRAEAGGRSAMFQDLGPQANATTGVVGLLFRAGDLH